MTYKLYDVVVANAPFSDIDKSKPRPMVIVSSNKFNAINDHITTCMITGAEVTKWPDDLKIKNVPEAGLDRQSTIRAKFFTIDKKIIKKKIGKLSADDAKNLKKQFGKILFA